MKHIHLVVKMLIAVIVPVILGLSIEVTPNLTPPESTIIKFILVFIVVWSSINFYDRFVLRKHKSVEERIVYIEEDVRATHHKLDKVYEVLENRNGQSVEEMFFEAKNADEFENKNRYKEGWLTESELIDNQNPKSESEENI